MPTKNEILTFSLEIESMVYKDEVSYMDAIIENCENSGMEIEMAAKLISDPLRAKIQCEAEDLNFLPKSNTHKLPI